MDDNGNSSTPIKMSKEEFLAGATEPETYTPEMIEELKLMGMDKPNTVSWGDWMGPKKHSHVHEVVILMAASGATNKRIAEELGYTESRISILLSQSRMRAKITDRREQFWGENADKRFQNILPTAIDVAEDILKNPQERAQLRSDVAFRLMDRALGKPNQSVTVEGNLLAEMLFRLDKQEDMQEIGKETRELTEPKDQLDAFVDDEIPAEVHVGKRG